MKPNVRRAGHQGTRQGSPSYSADGTFADGFRAHLPTMTDLPTGLLRSHRGRQPRPRPPEEFKTAFAAVGMGRGAHNGGNHGRIIRSVSKGSWNFWTRRSTTTQDVVKGMVADCASAPPVPKLVVFGPWTVSRGSIGGAAASLAVDEFLQDRQQSRRPQPHGHSSDGSLFAALTVS